MNRYGRVSEFLREVNVTDAESVSEALRMLEFASRDIDAMCGRRFFARAETRYLTPASSLRVLLLEADLASLTTLEVDTDNDGDFDYTLVEGTDYWLAPDTVDYEPYWAIDLVRRDASQITSWPGYRRSVRAAGLWGYSFERDAAGTLASALTSGATTLTLAAGHGVATGDTIVIGSEQLDVTLVSGETATVSRGINGSTAAAADSGATVYRRRYPRPIEQATKLRAMDLWRGAETGFATTQGYDGTGRATGIGFTGATNYGIVRGLVKPFVRAVVA